MIDPTSYGVILTRPTGTKDDITDWFNRVSTGTYRTQQTCRGAGPRRIDVSAIIDSQSTRESIDFDVLEVSDPICGGGVCNTCCIVGSTSCHINCDSGSSIRIDGAQIQSCSCSETQCSIRTSISSSTFSCINPHC